MKKIRGKRLVGAAAVSVALATSLVACASAGDDAAPASTPTPTPAGLESVSFGPEATISSVMVDGRATVVPLSEEELVDLAAFVESEGVPLEQLEERYRDRANFGELSSWLQETGQAGFVVAGYETGAGDGDVWLRFRDEPSAELLDEIAERTAYRVRVEYGAPLDADALEAVMLEYYGAVIDQDAVAAAGSYLDAETDEVVIDFAPTDDTVSADEVASAARAAVAKSPLAEDAALVRVVITLDERAALSASTEPGP